MNVLPAQSPSSNVTTEWTIFKGYLKTELPYYYNRLSPGASEKQISQLEKYIGNQLPHEIKQLYAINNGEDTTWYIGGIFCGLRMLTIDQIKEEWNALKEIIDSDYNKNWNDPIYPVNSIQKAAFIEAWIPIFSDDNGNYIGIDLVPRAEGVSGQVINFGTDEFDHTVLATTSTELLNLINGYFRDGKTDDAMIYDENNNRLMFGLFAEGHLTDDLREIAHKKQVEI